MSDTVEIEDMIQNVLQDEVPAEGKKHGSLDATSCSEPVFFFFCFV